MSQASSSLVRLLVAVRQLYGAMYRFDQRASKILQLNATDLRCVNALENGPCSPSALAKDLGLTRGAMTAMVDRLVRGGFVERVRHSTDRRRYSIQLRNRFYRQAGQVYSQLGQAISQQFHHLPLRQQSAVVSSLVSLANAFDTSCGSGRVGRRPAPAKPPRRKAAAKS